MQQLIVSCRGSEEVRSKCAPLLEKHLQSTSWQWKRTEAEFPMQILLDVKFVAYSSALIRRRESRWQDVAFAHLYFLDCWDTEKYRLDVRPDLIEWFATLRDADTNDWLVVFDGSKARENRGRAQVAERLRNDLAKYGNRVIEIESVTKLTPLIRVLADQVLTSFDYWAQSFEAALKIERDECFSMEWSFLHYMVTQIQYSRLLLSVSIFDQASTQLDELDAMLSLLVSNYAATPTKPRWIEAFTIAKSDQDERLISLVALYSHFDESVRQLLAHDGSSSVDGGDVSTAVMAFGTNLRRVRAQIFSCQLSVILNRYACQTITAETACNRVIWYGAILVQAIRKEEAILSGITESESPFRRLSNALWCLEVLHFAGRICDLANVSSSESESMCTLWMTLCRMVQNLDPTQVNKTGGNIFKQDTPKDADVPLAALEKCMLDTTAYAEQFVKWHESALAMLKHHGWRRHARAIGIALAEFYRRRGKEEEALLLFLKLARQLEEDRWYRAYVGLLLTIGDDLLSRCTLRERLKLYGDLSCSADALSPDKLPADYCFKFKREFESDWAYERIRNSPVCPWFSIGRVKLDHAASRSVLCGSTISWAIVIENRFPEAMRIFSASLCCTFGTVSSEKKQQQQQRATKPMKLVDFRRESYSIGSDTADCSDLLTFDGDQIGEELAIGRNTLKFVGKTMIAGSCIPEHLHIRLGVDGRLDVLIRIPSELSVVCSVKTEEPNVILVSPSKGESLWAGVTQSIKFRLSAGALAQQPLIDDDKFLRLVTSNNDLQFASNNSDSNTDDSHPKVCTVEIASGLTSPGSTFEIERMVFCNIHGSNDIRTCELITHWRGRSFRHSLQFKPIFHWMSNLKVIGDRLLLTIALHNNDGQRSLVIRDPKLTFASLTPDGGDVDAELLNDPGEQDLYFAIPYTLAWYIPSACTCLGVIVFHYQFKDCLSDAYTCLADVALHKPIIVEANCQMASEKIVCRVGMACDFIVSLKALDRSLRSVDILVTLVVDPRFWACTSGVSEMVRLKENGLGQAFFQVTPQCVGFLPMPSVVTQLTGEVALNKACQAYVRSKGKQVHVLAPLSILRRSFNEKGPRAQVDMNL